MQKPIKLKILGKTGDVRSFLQELDLYFTATRTSAVIEHTDDDEAHVYVLIIPEVPR